MRRLDFEDKDEEILLEALGVEMEPAVDLKLSIWIKVLKTLGCEDWVRKLELRANLEQMIDGGYVSEAFQFAQKNNIKISKKHLIKAGDHCTKRVQSFLHAAPDGQTWKNWLIAAFYFYDHANYAPGLTALAHVLGQYGKFLEARVLRESAATVLDW